MKRRAVAAGLAVLLTLGLSACGGTGESSYDRMRREERERYTACIENGGSYSHTEDAWGDDWSCTK